MKQCSKCGDTKPLIEYHRDKHAKDGYVQRCKFCVKKKSIRWLEENRERNAATCRARYIANPEPYKANAKKWMKENPQRKAELDRAYQINNPHVHRATFHRRKARKKANGEFAITAKEWRKLYASPCVYCGSKNNIQADHVIPIARGGIHGISNLVPACQSCNASKRERTITEWKMAKRKAAN